MPNANAAAAAFLEHPGDHPGAGIAPQGLEHVAQHAKEVQAALAQGRPVDPHDGSFPLPPSAQGTPGQDHGEEFSDLMLLMASATTPQGHPAEFAHIPPPAAVDWGQLLLGLDPIGQACPPPLDWGSFDPSAGHGPA